MTHLSYECEEIKSGSQEDTIDLEALSASIRDDIQSIANEVMHFATVALHPLALRNRISTNLHYA